MDWPMVLRGIDDVLGSGKGRAEQAIQITELIRQGGATKVGLYGDAAGDRGDRLERTRGACPPALPGDPRAQRGRRCRQAGRGGQRRDR